MEIVVPLLAAPPLRAGGREAEASRWVGRLVGSGTDRGRPALAGWRRIAGALGRRRLVRAAAAGAGGYLGFQSTDRRRARPPEIGSRCRGGGWGLPRVPGGRPGGGHRRSGGRLDRPQVARPSW